ncbi:MAG: cob(I)yrinic acid a,c-diamide adenosyltransferase [Thermoplasmata archaeon]|nr:cob(I)yrinic acid a,c-diamide adenosyltransferase [Thermoplasmata archaeon]
MASGGSNSTRLYSRTGDRGETGLTGGARVTKTSARIRALGSYDELAAQLGVAEAFLPNRPEEQALLRRLSHEIFIANSELAAPGPTPKSSHRVETRHARRLEEDTDRLSASLEPIHSFVLPRGSPGGAQLQYARTLARRAERDLWTLHAEAPQREELLRWANRLSSLLFALALAVNRTEGFTEIPPDYSV